MNDPLAELTKLLNILQTPPPGTAKRWAAATRQSISKGKCARAAATIAATEVFPAEFVPNSFDNTKPAEWIMDLLNSIDRLA